MTDKRSYVILQERKCINDNGYIKEELVIWDLSLGVIFIIYLAFILLTQIWRR